MNNVPVPMDTADRARVPQFRNRGGNRPSGNFGTRAADAGQNFQRRRANPSANAPCFTCGSTEHWSRTCPNKRINLIDFDESTEQNYVQDPIEDLKARIQAMTPEEKGRLADEMGVTEDFLTV